MKFGLQPVKLARDQGQIPLKSLKFDSKISNNIATTTLV